MAVQPGAGPGGWSEPARSLPALRGRHSYRAEGSLPRAARVRTALSAACRKGLQRVAPAACLTCRVRAADAGWYPWGCGSWTRYRVRRGDRAIGQLEYSVESGTGAWALALSPTQKAAARKSGGLAASSRRDHDLDFTPWQTWQRPTLPRLKTEYHRRWGVSRPSSEWDRVQPPRNNHQVGKRVKQTGLSRRLSRPLERVPRRALVPRNHP